MQNHCEKRCFKTFLDTHCQEDNTKFLSKKLNALYKLNLLLLTLLALYIGKTEIVYYISECVPKTSAH
jgi:hypothetical protein